MNSGSGLQSANVHFKKVAGSYTVPASGGSFAYCNLCTGNPDGGDFNYKECDSGIVAAGNPIPTQANYRMIICVKIQ